MREQGRGGPAAAIRSARSPRCMGADGRLATHLPLLYELRLHRARGYGALKAILDILGEEEGLTLTEISQRLQRTPGSTKDYLSWLEDVDLVTARQKRYSFADPLLRVWVRLHCRATRADRRRSRARSAPLRAAAPAAAASRRSHGRGGRRSRSAGRPQDVGNYRDLTRDPAIHHLESLDSRARSRAASCSASFLLGPLARASASPATSTSTSKRLS